MRVRFRLSYLLIAIAITAPLAGLFAQVVRIRANHRQSNCLGHMFNICTELVGYRNAHGRFPRAVTIGPDGQSRQSWRALLCSSMDPNFARAYDITKPWNSPNNLKVAKIMPIFFGCDNDQTQPFRFTNYVALTYQGKSSMDPDGLELSPGPQPLLIEIPRSTIFLSEPVDMDVKDLPALAPPSDPGGYAVGFSDGRIRRLSHKDLLALFGRPSPSSPTKVRSGSQMNDRAGERVVPSPGERLPVALQSGGRGDYDEP